MAEQEVKFIVRGHFVSPDGKDLGPVKADTAADDRTAEELREALKAADVQIPTGAKKDDLLTLAAQHKV